MRLTSAALVLLLAAAPGCDWRKPLPRGKDSGPPVEVVDSRPGPVPSSGLPGSGQLPKTTIPVVDEHEPNDDREHAQPIEPGKGVRGSLAPPTALGAGKGADDWYAVSAGATATPQLLRIEASGSPQADLSLELYDAGQTGSAQPLARLDDHGRGEAEHVSLGVRPRQVLLVRVRGSVAAGGTEPQASTYQLLVQQSPAPPGSETEPNDAPEQATPATAEDLTGTLPWRGDEDFWVINVADAIYRRATTSDSAASPPGLKAAAILRVELRTPGATPALRLLLEPAADAAQADGGAAASAGGFRKLQFALELTAPKGSQELRLRNVGLPAGTARAFIGVRTLAPPVAKGGSEPRYQLRLGVEPQLEDAESEPNDDCAQASEPVLAATAGGSSEGSLAGFLWPGDSDCFRIRAAGGPRRHTVQLILPGAGSDCRAALEWVRSDGVERAAGPADGGTSSLQLKARGDALVRVSSREHKTCFDAPYRLLVRSEPDRP